MILSRQQIVGSIVYMTEMHLTCFYLYIVILFAVSKYIFLYKNMKNKSYQ